MYFSIIIPSYNRAGFIADTIRSVFNQSFQDFEILVVDDGSTDDTERIIRDNFHSPKLSYYKKENGERGAARNYGVRKAKGEYVVFLDSDDYLLNNHLEEARKFILLNPEVHVFRLNYYKEIPASVNYERNLVIPTLTVNRNLVRGNSLSCMGVFLRRMTAVENPFHENRIMAGLEDWELWLRLAAKFPIYNVNKFTGVLVHHDSRSVLDADVGKLIAKVDYFMRIILNNPEICAYYKDDIGKFRSSCYSYLSLHIAMIRKSRTKSLQYLLRALTFDPTFIFERRFYAIVKNLVL